MVWSCERTRVVRLFRIRHAQAWQRIAREERWWKARGVWPPPKEPERVAGGIVAPAGRVVPSAPLRAGVYGHLAASVGPTVGKGRQERRKFLIVQEQLAEAPSASG